MSTLRLSVGLLILMLLLGLVGCSSTSGLRTGAVPNVPKMRTVASVGDRPLPIVNGEPGDSMTADAEKPERLPKAGADGRVSGRVVDEKGEPVVNARVRLAVSSAPGGRVVRATTDRGGGFTLRGLRPGTTYTIIAEWEDAQGVMAGRSKVEAPDTDVRIALAPAGAGADAEPTDKGNGTRVNHVSRRDTPADRAEEQVAEVVGSPIKVEDLPPAPEAETFAPASSRQAEAETGPGESSATNRAGGWRKGARSPAGSAAASDPVPDNNVEPTLAPRRGSGKSGSKADFPVENSPQDDEGPNPLPPALEPGQASRGVNPAAPERDAQSQPSTAMTRARKSPTPQQETPPGALVALPPSSGPLPVASSDVPASLPPPAELPAAAAAAAAKVPGPGPSGSLASREELPPPAEPPGPGATGPVASTPDLPPPAEPLEAGPTGPVASTGELPPPAELPAFKPTGPIASSAELPAPVDAFAPSPASAPPSQPAPPAAPSRPQPRWRDLAASHGGPPPMEGERGTPPAGAGDPNTTRLVRGSPKEPESFCRFDPKFRRIDDFRLPDTKGRPVRFQDFDSDLILLDFWGTWCQPCIKSVPHMVDLQKRLGGKQLQVVGIACEREETPPAERAAGVAKIAQKLGINYPVLVSSLDGTCPLQKALHVQAFPTLILVDRQGRILWQDQGATRVTLARLDRMIALTTKSDKSDGRRRY